MSLTRFALLIAGSLPVVAEATAQRIDFKQALPAGTLAFVTLPDLDQSTQELQGMPLFQMWRQKELQEFLAPALAELATQWATGLQQAEGMHEQGVLPFPPKDILQLRLFAATVACTRLGISMQDGKPTPDVGILVHLDFGTSAPIWKQMIEFGLAQLEGAAGQQMTKNSAKAGGHDLTTWQMEGAPVSLNLAWVGDGIVLGTGTQEVASVLAALADKKKVLTETSHYKSVAAHVQDPGAELEVYIDVESGYSTVMNLLRVVQANTDDFPPELNLDGLDRALGALGLKSIKAVGATSTYQGTKCVSKSYMLCPAPERKGFLADGSKNLDLSRLAWVPKNATSVSATTLNFTALWDAAVGALKAYDPDLAEQVLGQLGQMEQQIGFSVREDLFGSIGSQMTSWTPPMQGVPGLGGGGSLFNDMSIIEMRDPERLLKCLTAIKAIAGGRLEFDKNTRDDVTTYYLKANVDVFGDLPINPLDMITPVFGFESGAMVFGFARSDVRKIMKALAGEPPKESIRSNKAFATMLEKLEPDGLTSISFSDYKASFENLYELAYGLSYMVPEDFPLEVDKLPDEGQFLSQHLFPALSYSYTDGNGFSTMQSSPFGPEAAALLGAGLAGAGAAVGAQRQALMRRR